MGIAAGKIISSSGTKRISKQRQRTLAAGFSPYWGAQVLNPQVQFPPRSDHSPMRQCEADDRIAVHVAPAPYLNVDPISGRPCCEECTADRHDRWMRHLRSEGLLSGPSMEDEEQRERQRLQGLPTTHSPSARAMNALRNAHAELVEIRLPNERDAVKQLRRYRELEPTLGAKAALEISFGDAE